MAARIHYADDGPRDAPVVVMGPSLGTTVELWAPQVPALARGWRVIRYDLRGHGGSEVVPGPCTVADLADDVLALLDRLGVERFAYAGISLGGAVGTALALRAADRVASLALVCTSARFGDPRQWRERAALVRAEGSTASVVTLIPGRWFTVGFAERAPAVVEAILAEARANDPEGTAACCDALAAFDARDRLAEIAAPTVVVAAELDPSTPPDDGRVLADGIPGARFVLIPGAAHLAPVERAEDVTAVLVEHLEATWPHASTGDAPSTASGYHGT